MQNIPHKRNGGLFRGVNLLNFRNYWRILDVPFKDKGVVKSMGAEFDPALRSWVVPNIGSRCLYKYWHPEFKKFLFNDKFVILKKMAEGGQSVILGYDSRMKGEVV